MSTSGLFEQSAKESSKSYTKVTYVSAKRNVRVSSLSRRVTANHDRLQTSTLTDSWQTVGEACNTLLTTLSNTLLTTLSNTLLTTLSIPILPILNTSRGRHHRHPLSISKHTRNHGLLRLDHASPETLRPQLLPLRLIPLGTYSLQPMHLALTSLSTTLSQLLALDPMSLRSYHLQKPLLDLGSLRSDRRQLLLLTPMSTRTCHLLLMRHDPLSRKFSRLQLLLLRLSSLCFNYLLRI